MSKINSVRKCKVVFLTCELLGTSGANLTNFVRNNLEISIISWLPIENKKISSDPKGDRINEHSFKTWNKFMQWLRLKKFKVIKYFKALTQWKWKCDENEDKSCTTINDKNMMRVCMIRVM